MKRFLVVSFLSLAFLIGLSGCHRSEKNVVVSNIPYQIRLMTSLVLNKEAVKKELINVVSSTENADLNYIVCKMADKSCVFIFYDEKGNFEFLWQLKFLLYKNDFSFLTRGSSEDDVRTIDPYTTIWGDEDGTSEHRCIDGTLVTISYVKKDGKWNVDEVKYIDDDFHFINRISKEDLEKVTPTKN